MAGLCHCVIIAARMQTALSLHCALTGYHDCADVGSAQLLYDRLGLGLQLVLHDQQPQEG